MKNPFNPGSGTPPPFLAGREKHLEIFTKALDSIEDGHVENIILSGLRGTGKTVLMEEFNKICVTKGFLPIKRLQFSRKYCDTAEFSKALKFDVRTSIERFSKLNWIKGRISHALSYIKPKEVGIPNAFYYEPSYDSTTDIPFEDHLKDYLQKNWAIFENSNYKGVVFLFDEFHTVSDIPYNHTYALSDFLGALNEVQKNQCKYFVVLSGLPNLQLNVKKARSYSERMYRTLEVGNLTKDEAKLAISKPLNQSQYKFETSLVEKIITETGQYPYFIQFYCKELINNICKKRILLKDFNRINPAILRQLDDDFFSPRIEMLSDEEKHVIFSIAKIGQEDIQFSRIMEKIPMKRNALAVYLKRLEDKGLIYKFKEGVYRFSVPRLREYILRQS